MESEEEINHIISLLYSNDYDLSRLGFSLLQLTRFYEYYGNLKQINMYGGSWSLRDLALSLEYITDTKDYVTLSLYKTLGDGVKQILQLSIWSDKLLTQHLKRNEL